MTIPTSGSYSGIYIYQEGGIPAALDTPLATVELALGGLNPLGGLTFLQDTIASDATVSFNGDQLSYTDPTGDVGSIGYSTPTTQSLTTFETVATNGITYLVSNGPVDSTIGVTLDSVIQAAISAATPGSAAATALETFKTAVDNAYLGNLVVVQNASLAGTYAPPCFARGTRIATVEGEMAVEALTPGVRVLLARGGSSEVRWVGHRRVRIDATNRPELQRPIRIRAGALGNGIPRRDLVVSPDHALYLGGALVPAGLLVNGDRIRQEDVDTIEYFHVELAEHDVLLAEGAAAESYLDTGNRHTFANAGLVALRPEFPEPGSERDGEGCAELLLGGDRLQAIRDRLAAIPDETIRAAS